MLVFPDCLMLTCWFHVTQNIWLKCIQMAVPRPLVDAFYELVYDVHFATDAEDYSSKILHLEMGVRRMNNVNLNRLYAHFRRQWMEEGGSVFFKWQHYHTAAAKATTNNPLETHHKPLKSDIGGKKKSMVELFRGVEQAMTKECAREHQEYQC